MAVFGTNLEHGQRFNRRLVLDQIRRDGPLSRADIARRTGLSAQTISNIVEQLKGENLLLEQTLRSGGRGQPPIQIQIKPDAAYAFGIAFDHNRLTVILIDLGGAICGEIVLPLTRSIPAVILPLIEAAVQSLLTEHVVPLERIWGAGIVLPALVRRGGLTALGPASVSGWDDYPVADELQQRLGFPVLVDNDATAGAIGELLYGAGRQLRSFFYIYIGVGIGGGIIIDGRPSRGAYGMAGEIAHIVSVPGGRACPCGNRGCLERYASLSAAQSALTGQAEGAAPVDIDAIAEAFAADDERHRRWLAEAAPPLRNAIATVENLFDPEAVILGGLIPDAMLDALIAALEPLPPSVSSRHNKDSRRLIKATAGLDAPALGAASLAIFDTMTPDFAVMMKQTPMGETPATLPGGDP